MPKGRPDKGYALTPQREAVLSFLVAAGGELHDPLGLVVGKLREQLGYDNTQALSMLLNQLEKAGLIRREVVGRRTYCIKVIRDAIAPEDAVRIGLTERQPIAEPRRLASATRPGVPVANHELTAALAEIDRLRRIIVRQAEVLAQV